MFKAVSECCFNADWSLKQKFAHARKVGFEAMEPDFTLDGPLSPKSSDAKILEVAKLAADEGVRLTSLTTGVYWGNPPTSDDENVRKNAKALLKRQLEIAKLIGAPVILMVPGTVGKGFWGTGTSYDLAYGRAGEMLDSLEAYARELDVIIGVENVWNQFLLSPLEMARFIDERNSSHIQSYLDIGNVLVTANPVDWIRILGKRIARIHVKDFKKSVGNIEGFTELLCGDLDFPAAVAALKQVGYDGPLTVEIGPDNKYPGASVARAAAAMDLILG